MKFYYSGALALMLGVVQQSTAFTVNTPTKATTALHALASPLTLGPEDKIEGGNTLRTWTMPVTAENAQIMLKTDGRPMNARVEIWQGPDYTPYTMDIYLENGDVSPFKAILHFPKGTNTISIRNVAEYEFPLIASVAVEQGGELKEVQDEIQDKCDRRLIQGGAVTTIPVPNEIDSMQVLFNTEMRAHKANIEVLQGPNNLKQKIELFCSGGNRPFYAIFETPGADYVLRVINTNHLEFPINAYVEPYMIGNQLAPL
jgi:hypothetical protein